MELGRSGRRHRRRHGDRELGGWARALLRQRAARRQQRPQDGRPDPPAHGNTRRPRHRSAPLAGRPRPPRRRDLADLRRSVAALRLQAPAQRHARVEPRDGRGRDLPARQGAGLLTVTIYHNPSCGTSRNTLAMIRQSGEEPEVIEYLKTPPSRERLLELAKAIGIPVRALLREKEK